MGQPFQLNSTTEFRLNPSADSSEPGGSISLNYRESGYDFNHATIDLRGGSFYPGTDYSVYPYHAAPTIRANVRLRGGSISPLSLAEGTLHATDGSINNTLRLINSDALILGTHLNHVELASPSTQSAAILNIAQLGKTTLDFNSGTAKYISVLGDHQVNITGGSVERVQTSYFTEGGSVNIAGGEIGTLEIYSRDSTADISAGLVRSLFLGTHPGCKAIITGGEFAANSTPLNGATYDPPDHYSFTPEIISGVFTNGSAFIMELAGTHLSPDNIQLIDLSLPPRNTDPQTIADAVAPPQIRRGEILTLTGSATLPNSFTAVGGHLTLTNGSHGETIRAVNTAIDVIAGTLHPDVELGPGTSLRLHDATTTGTIICDRTELLDIRSTEVNNYLRLERSGSFNATDAAFRARVFARDTQTVSLSSCVMQEPAEFDRIGQLSIDKNTHYAETEIPSGENNTISRTTFHGPVDSGNANFTDCTFNASVVSYGARFLNCTFNNQPVSESAHYRDSHFTQGVAVSGCCGSNRRPTTRVENSIISGGVRIQRRGRCVIDNSAFDVAHATDNSRLFLEVSSLRVDDRLVDLTTDYRQVGTFHIQPDDAGTVLTGRFRNGTTFTVRFDCTAEPGTVCLMDESCLFVTQSASGLADFNNDTLTTTGDILSFLSAWTASDPRTDTDLDTRYTIQDIMLYLDWWNQSQ